MVVFNRNLIFRCMLSVHKNLVLEPKIKYEENILNNLSINSRHIALIKYYY